METQIRIEGTEEGLERSEAAPRWSLTTRIAFRFCFLYFTSYVTVTQLLPTIILLPKIDVPDPGTFPPVRPAIAWVAKHIFGVSTKLVVTGSGSGDKIFDWTEVFCLLVAAALGTAVWSVLVRRRPSYVILHQWARLLARFALGSTFILYGVSKIIPLQMPYPYLSRLVEPFGNSSPMGLLWSFIGASPAYETLTGCAETIGGVLILLPRTALLGTLICLADALQIFLLNMAYDVPVKLFSVHLILFAVFLVAPDAGRLWRFLVLNRAAGPSRQPELFRTRRANRMAATLQTLYVVYLLGTNLYNSATGWKEYGGGAPRSPLYGIWNVEQMTLDGMPRAAIVSDPNCWRRVLFQFPTSATFQHMDDSLVTYKASITATDNKLALSKYDDNKWKARFLIERPDPERLVLDGEMDNRKLRLELRLVDHTKFLLVSRGFHWVQDYPLNR